MRPGKPFPPRHLGLRGGGTAAGLERRQGWGEQRGRDPELDSRDGGRPQHRGHELGQWEETEHRARREKGGLGEEG